MPRIVVYHTYYGCDTGCCGHAIEVEDDDGSIPKRKRRNFDFGDCGETDDPLKCAQEMVRDAFGEEHVKDLDWENCVIYDYNHTPMTKKEFHD